LAFEEERIISDGGILRSTVFSYLRRRLHSLRWPSMRTLVPRRVITKAKTAISQFSRLETDNRVVVLLYHSISDTAPHSSATPTMFRQHLEWLKTQCEVVPFRKILERTRVPSTNGPVVAITFDDGFADNYEHAWPALNHYGLPSTFFVCTGLIDGWRSITNRFMCLLDAPRDEVTGFTWNQAREMHESGTEFGVHTVSHANLSRLDDATARWELNESKETLEDQLGTAATLFAYPFGKPKHHFTSSTVGIVEEAGFELAAVVNDRGLRATEDPLAIPRISVNGDDLVTLQAKVSGQFDSLGIWQERAPRWLSHMVSPHNSHRDVESIQSATT
jgi:peptidoglycan/xylan/chitin deacetylase (PgdA/CDA1 family)